MMLVKMLKGKDLYYPGELVSLDDATAQEWIAAGLAEPALCPDCGAVLEPRGWGACCPECGAKNWERIC